MIAFNKSVRGFSHITKNIECQDSSKTSDINTIIADCFLVAVADGHGDRTCIRSQIGSNLAVQSAINVVEEFLCESRGVDGGAYQLFIDDENYTVKILTDTIIYEWLKRVHNDFNSSPLTDKEREDSGNYLKLYEQGTEIEHAYGTTLLIALVTKEYIILIHQGDGRCIVFWEDGSCEQPVKWDDKCDANITTSMCDENAAERIRHAFIPLNGKKPMAVFLTSDGVEDAYPDIDGAYAFLRDVLVNDLAEGTREEIEDRMQETLAYYSEHGSGDDMSIAGVIDQELIKARADALTKLRNDYMIDTKKATLQNRLKSMRRKDIILHERAEDAENEEQKRHYISEYEEYHSEYVNLKKQLEDLLQEEREK